MDSSTPTVIRPTITVPIARLSDSVWCVQGDQHVTINTETAVLTITHTGETFGNPFMYCTDANGKFSMKMMGTDRFRHFIEHGGPENAIKTTTGNVCIHLGARPHGIAFVIVTPMRLV